jgi:hypothetical protein
MFRAAPVIEDQPKVVTDIWRTYVINNDVILVCIIPETGKVRTTTPVLSYDPAKQEFVTESGRIYQCVGPMSACTLTFRMTLFLNGLIEDVDTFTGDPAIVQ